MKEKQLQGKKTEPGKGVTAGGGIRRNSGEGGTAGHLRTKRGGNRVQKLQTKEWESLATEMMEQDGRRGESAGEEIDGGGNPGAQKEKPPTFPQGRRGKRGGGGRWAGFRW